ncbi:MAG: choice-of-anchor L domain-containing protein [Flavobacteriales bacterium]
MSKLFTLCITLILSISNGVYSQINVDCAAGHVNTTYCYTDNDTTQFVFTNTDGLPLNVLFNAGEVEVNFDELIILDTDGVTNLNAGLPYGNAGNLTGLEFQSSGDTITVMIDSDSVISCQTNGFTEWDWDVWCQTCLNPTVSYETTDCVEGENFSVLVNITDLGTATTLNINDDQGSPQQTVTTPQTVTFGPYTSDTIVIITVSNADDANCIITSDNISCLSGIFEINESFTTQELVEDILFDSNCVALSNFSQSTGTNFGDVNGIAAFNSNGSDFPYQTGIVLSSGNVQNVPGPNLDIHSDGGFDWPGDADLEANTTATDTNNASYIQFDFTPSIDQISFNFLLASEEYNQLFECEYSDAFAFILTDQNTGVVQNLAVLPGTNIPIEVTNIHPDVPGLCNAINEEYFDKYNFSPYNNENEATIDFNGQIISLQAVGDVIVGNQYTIKLVMADETDTAYDSAVFIEAGSFNVGDVNLGDDITIANGNAVCDYDEITIGIDPIENATYKWFKDDVEIVGETSNTLVVTEEGLYRIEVAFSENQDCISLDEILVEFLPSPIFDLGEDQVICDTDQYIIETNVSNLDELTNVTYKWFLEGIELAGETQSTLTISQSGLYTVEVTGNGCSITDEVTISIELFTVSLGEDLNLCGEVSTDLTAEVTGENAGDATFLWSPGGETTQTITVTTAGTYTVEVTVNNCVTTESINVIIGEYPNIELGDSFETCFDQQIILDASPSNYDPDEVTYEWSLDGVILTDQNQAVLEATEYGIYSVIVTFGFCSSEDSITISPRADLEISLNPNFKTCPNEIHTITSNTNENGVSYQWFENGDLISGETGSSIDISIDEDTFNTQIYTVVISKGNCTGTASIEVSLYDNNNCVITQGISPNGDGFNDNFDLEFLNDQSGIKKLSVFNRLGTLVYEQNNYVNQWYGQTNDGNNLPVGTYFYVIELTTDDPITGWIYINKKK